MTYPKVAIIILNWNGLADTTECLQSLQKISYPNYNILLIDNGSRGNDSEVLQNSFCDYIHLIKNAANLGFAGGVNVGIRDAQNHYKPDYFLLLNNDTVVSSDFLTKIVELANTDNTIGIVGPKAYQYWSPDHTNGIRVRLNWWIACIGMNKIEVWRFHDPDEKGIDGCCQLIKNELIEKIGLFDESYFCYWEDQDFHIRTKEAGYRVVLASTAKIWHKGGQTSKKISGFTCYYSTRNKIRFMKKHSTKWQFRWFMIYNLLFYLELMLIIYLIIKPNPQAVVGCCRGMKDGLLNRDTAAKSYGDQRISYK